MDLAFIPGVRVFSFWASRAKKQIAPWSELLMLGGMGSGKEHPAVALAEDRLKRHVRRFLPHVRVWLFGSRATGKGQRRSDFDLALQPGEETPDSALWEFEQAVHADPEIIYPVDIVDLRTAPENLRERIQREGVVWKN